MVVLAAPCARNFQSILQEYEALLVRKLEEDSAGKTRSKTAYAASRKMLMLELIIPVR
jgi:hypothetical protein